MYSHSRTGPRPWTPTLLKDIIPKLFCRHPHFLLSDQLKKIEVPTLFQNVITLHLIGILRGKTVLMYTERQLTEKNNCYPWRQNISQETQKCNVALSL